MIYLLLSFFIVAFGGPASLSSLGILAAALGYALFWRESLKFSRSRDRFLVSLIWFSAVQGVQLSWMTTTDYMGPLILLVYLFLILAMGVQFGVLSLILTSPLKWERILAIAGCWTIMEWIRLFFLCGFTFNHVGLSLTSAIYSLQFASIWGIFGLSFWVILVNLVALKALSEKKRGSFALWGSLAIFPYAFGFIQQSWVERTPPLGTFKVALVQTALFPEQKDFMPDFADAYIHPIDQWERILSVLKPEQKIDLLVLPEAALPLGARRAKYELEEIKKVWIKYLGEGSIAHLYPFKNPNAHFDRGVWKVNNLFLLQALSTFLNAHIITGLDDHDATGRYNAAFHFQPEKVTPQRYEKRILAPIGEYVPFQNWKPFAKFVAEQFGIYSSFDPGTEIKIFDLVKGDEPDLTGDSERLQAALNNDHVIGNRLKSSLSKRTVPAGISICLEETFSNLTRELRLKGAQLFVNLTNDVWFPRSKLTSQHFFHGRVRAVENGVCMIRSCNTGITGGVDCFGRLFAHLPVSEKTPSSLYFSIPIKSYSTLYTLWGDGAIIGISISCLVLVALKRRVS